MCYPTSPTTRHSNTKVFILLCTSCDLIHSLTLRLKGNAHFTTVSLHGRMSAISKILLVKCMFSLSVGDHISQFNPDSERTESRHLYSVPLVSSLWMNLYASTLEHCSLQSSVHTPAGPAQCSPPSGTPSGHKSERDKGQRSA